MVPFSVTDLEIKLSCHKKKAGLMFHLMNLGVPPVQTAGRAGKGPPEI